MIKKLLIATLCLIVFEVILFATGWELFKPADSICKIVMYSLCEIIICLYLYRILKRETANYILVGMILVFILSALPFVAYGLLGISVIVIFSPFYLILCMIAVIYYWYDLKKSIIKDMKVGLSLLIFIAISILFGVNVFFLKDGTTSLHFHDDKYEVRQAGRSFLMIEYMTEIYQVKGPFRKSIYTDRGTGFEYLESDKAIEEYLKQNEK